MIEVSITDTDQACSDAAGHGVAVGTRLLRAYIFNERDNQIIPPGTYGWSPDAGDATGTVSAGFFWHDHRGACSAPYEQQAVNGGFGTITLDEVSATAVRGSLNISLNSPNGGSLATNHLEGTFDAPVCTGRGRRAADGLCD